MKREKTKRAQLLDERSSAWADESVLDSTTKLIPMHKMVVDGSLNHQDGMTCRTLKKPSLDNLSIDINQC